MKDSNTQIIYNRFSGFVAYQKTDEGIKIIYEEDPYGKKIIDGLQSKSYERGIGGVQ
tara:strand:+ start:1887 stop:2057 length:171 start_codon:yes stop_codon:yes gene_type:complete